MGQARTGVPPELLLGSVRGENHALDGGDDEEDGGVYNAYGVDAVALPHVRDADAVRHHEEEEADEEAEGVGDADVPVVDEERIRRPAHAVRHRHHERQRVERLRQAGACEHPHPRALIGMCP